jgi:hypothetical protein
MDASALDALITAAYADINVRLAGESPQALRS